MFLAENHLYHFYNQGNYGQQIFFNRTNKLTFLDKFRKYVSPHCKVLAYCLMPNHFHFMLYLNQDATKPVKVGNIEVPTIKNGFRCLLSSYAQIINSQENRKGSLFKQKTQFRTLDAESYPLTCFQYIHQNPFRAGLVKKMEDWEFSSFRDYLGIRTGTLCDQNFAINILNLSKNNFYREAYEILEEDRVKNLFGLTV